MRKILLFAVLAIVGLTVQANEPTMTVTTGNGSQEIALSTLRKVTYSGDNMVVVLRDGTNSTFAMAEVASVTLQNIPEPTTPQDAETVRSNESKARKVLINGVIYIEKDGQRFSILGAKL